MPGRWSDWHIVQGGRRMRVWADPSNPRGTTYRQYDFEQAPIYDPENNVLSSTVAQALFAVESTPRSAFDWARPASTQPSRLTQTADPSGTVVGAFNTDFHSEDVHRDGMLSRDYSVRHRKKGHGSNGSGGMVDSSFKVANQAPIPAPPQQSPAAIHALQILGPEIAQLPAVVDLIPQAPRAGEIEFTIIKECIEENAEAGRSLRVLTQMLQQKYQNERAGDGTSYPKSTRDQNQAPAQAREFLDGMDKANLNEEELETKSKFDENNDYDSRETRLQYQARRLRKMKNLQHDTVSSHHTDPGHQAEEPEPEPEDDVSRQADRKELEDVQRKVDDLDGNSPEDHLLLAETPHVESAVVLHTMPPTDSGYASYKPLQSTHLVHEELERVTGSLELNKPTYAPTNYSDNASLETTRRETFVEKLAEKLVADLGIKTVNTENVLDLCNELAEILAEFALKLGCNNSIKELQRAMVFIHKYRRYISRCFRLMILCQTDENDDENDEGRAKSDDMPLSDKMRMYIDSMVADPAEDLAPDMSDINNAEGSGYDIESEQQSTLLDDIEDFDKHLSCVCKTSHYEWLLAVLRCKMTLTSSNPVVSEVRQTIMQALPQAKDMRKAACRSFQAVFNVEWAPQEVLGQRWRSFDPNSFPRKQPWLDHHGDADEDSAISPFTLGHVLTITGESSDAQALSCSAYLAQTWPMTGHYVLQLIEEVVVHGVNSERFIKQTDGTQLTVSQENEWSLRVLVSGTRDVIAEVGEQLAWLGAALRCSPPEQGVFYCIAGIKNSTENSVAELGMKSTGSIGASHSAKTQSHTRYQKFDEKCSSMSIDELQREWEHYTRLISGGATSTAVSGAAIPFTLSVSDIGVGLAAPAIYNARKKCGIIERHLQRLGTTNHTRKRDDLTLVSRTKPFPDTKKAFIFDLDFRLEQAPMTPLSSGTCWQHLFGSPVIARGFPVIRRHQPNLGLEMPLNVMAGLLGTSFATTFDGGVFLKGYSAVLYPTKTMEDVVVWHLNFDKGKTYMPYPSKDQTEFVEVDSAGLAKLRHIIGWCKTAENRTGIANGSYKTRRSRLGRVGADGVLKSYALSFGNSIVGGKRFTLLNGHDSLQVRRKTYSTMLKYLSTQFVVFFDVQDCRGWLVNGINALYHILRSSLEEDKTDSMQNQNSLFLLKSDQLIEPEDAGAASAARHFLDNKDNLFCKISLSDVVSTRNDHGKPASNEEEYETLAHRVEQFHNALEVLFNYQVLAEESRGRLQRSRAVYEGWDFVNITRCRDQKPCTMELPLKGLACVDFLRSSHAVTLFGKEFGELILPSSDTCCQGWQTLPKMKYYIASNVADIQKLIEEQGDADVDLQKPPFLSGKIMWYSPQASTGSCGCGGEHEALAGLVQVPWPRRHKSFIQDMKGPVKLEAKGAVVFGYNDLVPWHWPEIGDPIPGPPPEVEVETSDEDSGLGSGIDLSATEQSSMTTIPTTVPRSLDRGGDSHFFSMEQSHNTYGNATVRGGSNIFGDSINIVYNYPQQTADGLVLDSVSSESGRRRNKIHSAGDTIPSKKRRVA